MIELKLANGITINLNVGKVFYTYSVKGQLGAKDSYKIFLGMTEVELADELEFNKINNALLSYMGPA